MMMNAIDILLWWMNKVSWLLALIFLFNFPVSCHLNSSMSLLIILTCYKYWQQLFYKAKQYVIVTTGSQFSKPCTRSSTSYLSQNQVAGIWSETFLGGHFRDHEHSVERAIELIYRRSRDWETQSFGEMKTDRTGAIPGGFNLQAFTKTWKKRTVHLSFNKYFV